MTPSALSRRSRKLAPRAMAARNSGASDSSARAEPSASATMSAMESRPRSNRTARGAVCESAARIGRLLLPEIVKVEPFERRFEAIVLEPPRVIRRQLRERPVAAVARQADRLAEQLEVNFRRAAAAEREQQIHRALKQARQDIRADRERRRRAEEHGRREPGTSRYWNAVARHREAIGR